ncbi:MAG: aromatic ring-hydroxylating dioxygenase subunit alpha [Dehalococcoidia bacterium]|nr:aromatic ring-hydroxylating dioxygenase subunit alpha [Dehalococcoidia bacterium]
MTTVSGSMKSMVNSSKGLLDRSIYTDEAIYAQELEQIFGRMWLFVGHESQVKKPNDFVANYMGEDPILVTRDAKGKLHTFLNMCRHRGNRICRADAGNAPSFMCTYHGWTFATDGKLVGVPGYKEAYFEELDRSQWGLVEARTDSYKGLIFATWDQKAPSLLDYLGDATWYMDLVVDRRDGGAELITGAHRWPFPCNWKFGAENFGGDNHHVPISHGSVGAANINRRTTTGQMSTDATRFNVHTGNGHCIIGGYTGSDLNVQMLASTQDAKPYFEANIPELRERLGSQRAKQVSMGIATIFPNFTWFGFSGCMIRNWHPKGPGKTELWTYCIVDAKAPPEVREAIRRRLTLCFSPSGTFEQDDGNNFFQSTKSGNYHEGRKYPMNIQMGMNRETKSELIPGTLSPNVSENNARFFYDRWSEVMDAPSWDGIHIDPKTR